MKFKFNDNQDFQLKAINNVVELFNGLGDYSIQTNALTNIHSIEPNMPEDEDLDEEWLLENLQFVQEEFDAEMDAKQTPTMKIGASLDLEKEEGQMLEGVSNDTFSYPSFSIEMETGTGKTYVYLRSILELNQKYGFSKFIIVVPSIAIYQGVKKSFEITRDHFRTIYGNERVDLRPYDGNKPQDVKAFATNKNVEILLITLAAFNSKTNNLYKSTDKLPGELKPFEYIQQTRPIVIMDEPQNMNSQISKDAVRTLKPLFSLRYSATHKDTPNLVYRLTPVEAFRRNLVKRIQVVGIEQVDTGGKALMSLKTVKGKGRSAKATIVANTSKNGVVKVEEIILKQDQVLFEKTNLEEHRGYTVTNIGSEKGNEFIQFENEVTLTTEGGDGVSRPDIFRYQIRETIEQHILHQQKMKKRGVKVISLFFIDKVKNFIGDGKNEGIIKRIFNEEFRRLRDTLEDFKDKSPDEVQASYFSIIRKKKKDGTTDILIDNDFDKASKREREKVQKKQFELIMKNKEQLLSFKEPVCFIFAHSALKEGWDNPNVFQICTLNQTLSVTKKRQEIGRGLRLAVNQEGERLHDDQVNILTVVANESYESFANSLQQEYVEKEGEAPPAPKPKRAPAKRNNEYYTSEDFKAFWKKLTLKSKYNIVVKTDELINEIEEKLKEPHNKFPSPKMVITKGNFVMTSFNFKIKSIEEGKALVSIIKEDSIGNRKILGGGLFGDEGIPLVEGLNLEKELKEPKLRGFVVHNIESYKSDPEVLFKNGERVTRFKPLNYQVSDNRERGSRESQVSQQRFSIFNIIDKLEQATKLTKDTCFKILQKVPLEEQQKIFQNPEGFSNKLIDIVKNTLANHVAENINFEISSASMDKDVEELFPANIDYVQSEIVPTPNHGLYDNTQKDSDIEEQFITNKLEADNNVNLFFKFPSKYKIDFPKIIGNYNPDWAVIRKDKDGVKIQLVRETKGTADVSKLRFSHEIRKVKVAHKHFSALGIDYDVIKGDEPTWYIKKNINPEQQDKMF